MDDVSVTPVRLDLWLDVARLFKTRSEAGRACALGKVTVGGVRAKAHRLLRGGEEVVIARTFGRVQTVRVTGVVDRHVQKAAARALFDDLTPEPTAEEREMRRVERMYREAAAAAGADRRARRSIRRRKESG